MAGDAAGDDFGSDLFHAAPSSSTPSASTPSAEAMQEAPSIIDEAIADLIRDVGAAIKDPETLRDLIDTVQPYLPQPPGGRAGPTSRPGPGASGSDASMPASSPPAGGAQGTAAPDPAGELHPVWADAIARIVQLPDPHYQDLVGQVVEQTSRDEMAQLLQTVLAGRDPSEAQPVVAYLDHVDQDAAADGDDR